MTEALMIPIPVETDAMFAILYLPKEKANKCLNAATSCGHSTDIILKS